MARLPGRRRLVAAEEMCYADELERFKEPRAQVRVWDSDAPDELCGFAFLMDLLTQIHFGGPVWAVKQPCRVFPLTLQCRILLSRLVVRSGPEQSGSPSPGWRGLSPQREQGRMGSCIWQGLRSGKRAAPGSGQRPNYRAFRRIFMTASLRHEISRGSEAEFAGGVSRFGRTIGRLPALGDAMIALAGAGYDLTGREPGSHRHTDTTSRLPPFVGADRAARYAFPQK